MKQILSIAAESIVREKLPHAANAAATLTAAAAGATTSVFGTILGWLPHVAVLLGLCVSCAIFYKTLRDIRSTNLDIKEKEIRIAKESRRQEDKGK